MTIRYGLIGAALTLLSTNGYGAAITGTGDPISNAALNGGTAETFDAGPAGDSSSLVLGNVNFQGIDAPLTVGNEYIGDFNTRGVYSVYNGGDNVPTNFRFDFSVPVDAFAFNWGAADINWTLTAYDANDVSLDSFVLTPTGPSNAGEYFGITASNIAYATLIADGTGDWVFLDNFTYSGDLVAATSEPVPALPLPMLILTTILLTASGRRGLRRN